MLWKALIKINLKFYAFLVEQQLMCLSRDAWRQLVLSSLGETDFEWGHTGMSARSGRCVVQEWKPPYPTFQKLYLTHGF